MVCIKQLLSRVFKTLHFSINAVFSELTESTLLEKGDGTRNITMRDWNRSTWVQLTDSDRV